MTIRRDVALGFAAMLLLPLVLQAQINVLTNRYDPARTGANLAETTLTTANVDATRFGKLYSYPVDGGIYAQPLYVAGVAINGTRHNVLYVATMNDTLYAFDADSPSPTPLWTAAFANPPSSTPVPIIDIVGVNNRNIVGNVGIQSTPVIDPATNTLYLVARTKESGAYVQRLHAIDITNGHARAGSPATIAASVPGTAMDSTVGPNGRVVTFDPKMHVQRAGLALSHGVVLIGWAAHEDITPSHGWIMGYDAATLAQVASIAITPDDMLGGVWQGGRAPTIDAAGNAYFTTGNGDWNGTTNFGESLLKFGVSTTGLTLLDYFTPSNEQNLTIDDDDLSGSGFTLLPGTHLMIGGGKEGVLYLVNADNLGHKVANDTQIVQKIPVNGGHVMGGAVFWNAPNAGPLVYNWSERDVLTAYQLSGGRLIVVPYALGSVQSPGHPGGSLTLSANGSAAGSGIVWASMPTSKDARNGLAAGILRAFHAETLQELWNSDQNPTRDRLGNLTKFVPPVVVNGRVYLPNQDKAVAVYGLLAEDFSIGVTPTSQTVAAGTQAAFTVTVGAQNGFGSQVTLSAAGQPSGTTVAFNPSSVTGGGTSTMTVTVPSGATSSSFMLTVKGTSGTDVRSAVVTVNVTAAGGGAGTGAIGINFVGTATAMGTTESAGVVAMSHWNNATGAIRSTALVLADDAGAATTASVTWAANGTWKTPIADQVGNRRLMNGYLDSSASSATTVTLSGLPQRTYDVYIYADGDNGGDARSASYSIGGSGITTTTVTLTDAPNTNFSSAFTQAANGAGNYVKFTVTATGFTITATPGPASTSTRRAPVNAVQIVPAAAPPTPAVSINFVGGSATPMAATESAGAIAKTHWNNATGASRSTPLALVSDSGAATSAAITWSAAGVWETPVADAAGNARMMQGYLDTTSTSTTTVAVSGLAQGSYDVYVYADGDNHGFNRTGSYTISGAGIASTTVALTDAANTTFSGTFTAAANSTGNYLKFSITASGFTLTATPVNDGSATLRAPVNAIQIVPR